MIRASSTTTRRPVSGQRPFRRPVRGALAAGVVGVGAAGLLALAPVSSASAHDYVVSSTPAEGSTQSTELTEASITFNDVVLDLSGTGSSNVLEVTDASGRHFEDGCSTSSGPTLSTGVALGAAGDYTMTYQAVSADGHTVSASLPFTWAPPAGATVAEGAAARPVCDTSDEGTAGEAGGQPTASAEPGGAESTSAAAPSASAGPADDATAGASDQPADADESNLGLVVGIGIGIVVLALAAVVVVLVTSRRRGDDLAGPAGDLDSTDSEAGAGRD
ncbi:copper resistance protein CopC [Frigoribacterium sp. PvP032]|uniref:copper resistance CopC family protein n=1 Tax=Frigoribacterium sp. PvP032 TaxID=2806589 RepID=UPI001B5BFDF5|nr:copper resistance protein CopC [Frigoribacterium sp. PvP032]MBP1191402.1 methionine-rich copper-binding protein CopC [Frigoribacterium sp. PvP032]